MKKFFLSLVLGAMLFSAPVFADNLYLIGDATSAGWSLDDAVVMAESSSNVFEWTGDLKIGELKFLKQKNAWVPSFGPLTIDEPMVVGTVDLQFRETEGEGTDHKFKVEACGWYTLKVNLNDTSLTVSVFYPETMYIIGPAVGGWSMDENAQTMTSTSAGIFTWKGTLAAGELKFFEQKDFGATAYGATVANAAISVPGQFAMEKLGGEDKKFVATAGNAKLTVDLKQMKLIVEDIATGITDAMEQDGEMMIFDLTGVQRAQMEKGGIYIVKKGNKTQKVICQ